VAVYCSRCNTANREGSRFCNNCGEALATPAEATCPQCQAPVLSGSTFCHRCGAELPAAAAPDVTPPEPITETDSEGEDQGADESDVISLDQVPATPDISLRAKRAAAALPPVEPEAAIEAGPAAAPDQQEAPASVAPAAPPAPQQPPWRTVQPLVRVRPSAGRRPLPPPPPQPGTGDNWRRLAYLILAAAVAIGVMLPPGTLGASTPSAPEVNALYSTIESLAARATVLVSFDYDPATDAEMRPLAQAVISHLMRQKARLLVMSLFPQGPALADAVIGPLATQNIYSYGLDYVHLGFLPGDEAALAALDAPLSEVFAADFVQGRPLSTFAVSRSATLAAVDLVVEISGDENGVRRWVEQVQSRQHVPLAAATSAVAMPLAYPYLQSGQIAGLASGLPAAAQYEKLLGYTGPATRGMDAQSLGQITILLFIVIGNLALLRTRRSQASQSAP
jgi:hypothetical protein